MHTSAQLFENKFLFRCFLAPHNHAKTVYTTHTMKKTTAIELLGGTPGKAAKALGYKAVQTIYAWPDDLPQALQDRIAGVLARTKKPRQKRAAS